MSARHLLSILLLTYSMIVQAQELPLDFESSMDSFVGFTGSSFTTGTDPNNAANPVGRFVNDGGDNFQGFFIDIARPIDLDASQEITLSFYTEDASAHNILFKLERGTGPDIEVLEQIPANPGAWTNVSFDFANAIQSGSNTAVNAAGQYSRLVIFIDFGVRVSGTYFIDNIEGSNVDSSDSNDIVYTDLVWSDEFNLTGERNPVDDSKWHHQTKMITPTGWANGELQHYTDRIDNSYVQDGMLHIVAKRERFTDQGQTKSFTSARLNSKFAFTYGRIDVRAKLPQGSGTWPAIWTLGKNINEDGGYWDNQYGRVNWPLTGEIDIMEHGLGAVNHVSAALHTACNGCFGATMNVRSFTLEDVANNFHVYSAIWSPQQITFLIDDQAFYTYNPTVKNVETFPFFEDQYMLLNVAMGGVAGSVDPNFTQSSMLVDYVRVYQNTLSSESSRSINARVYPNPARNQVNISTSRPIDKVELYNMLGQQVLEKNTHVRAIDLSPFANGIYVLKIAADQLVQQEKILISR